MTPLIMDYLVKPLIHTLSSLRHTLRFLLLLLCPPIFICLQVSRDVSHKSTHDQWMILFVNVLLCSVLTLMGYLPGILFCVYITCVKCEPVFMSYTSSLSSNASCMTIHNYNNYKKKNHNNNSSSDEDEEEEMVDIMHDSVVHVLPSLSQKQSPLHEVIVIPPLSLHFLSQQREEFDQRLQLQQQQQQLPTTTNSNSNSDDDEIDQNIMNDADNDHSMTSIQDMKDDDMSHGDDDDDTYSSTDQHTEHDAMYSTSTSCSSSLTNINHSHIHPLHHMTSSSLSSLSSYRSHSKFGSSSSTTATSATSANKSKVKKKGYFENEYDEDEEEEDYSV